MEPFSIIAIVLMTIAAIGGLGFGIYKLIQLKKMKPEERQAKVIEFLVGLVTVAENVYEDQGKGSDKLAWVTEQFKKEAPWFLKIIAKFCGGENIESLIERALEIAKNTIFDKRDKMEDK